jgi:hypothetical protein
LAKEDFKNRSIMIMNLPQWSYGLENKGNFKVIYVFKLWMFSSFKLVSSKHHCVAHDYALNNM